jgi:hypothetical protein
MISALLRLSCLLACIALASGCSTDTKNGTVAGNVTLDGQPLPTGLIRFVPADGQTATADATITDGKFTATMPVGEKRVSISSPKVVGKRKMYETADSPTVDSIQELLPPKYNAQSTLTITVKPGNQEQPYELTSN